MTLNTDDSSEQDYNLVLTGRTLRVYWFLLKTKKPLDRKEVQKGTRLSSASLAEYHLKKLVEIGLVEKSPHGEYAVTKVVQVGVTRFYINIRNSLIPRFALYSSFYLAVLISILTLSNNYSPDVIFLLLSIIVFGLITSIFEMVVLLRSSRF